MQYLPQQPLFPVLCLPPRIRDAAEEMAITLGIPIGMAAPILLSALSIAAQALIIVERINGLTGPASLWFLIVAMSGGRKSAAEDCAFQPIKEFEIEHAARFSVALQRFEAQSKAWIVKERVVLKAIGEAAQEGADTSELEKQLVILNQNKPIRPKQLRFLFNDISSAGIKERLHDSTSSMGVVTDEGAELFRGNALVDLSLPNRLWSGGTLQVDRANKKSFTVRDPRLTMSIQTQPGPLRRYLQRKGEEAREEGFWARMLTSFPDIQFGQRMIWSQDLAWKKQQPFRDRMREILELNVTSNGQSPEKIRLSFSPEAQERWIRAYNDIESMTAPGDLYGSVPDYGAKIADNVARVAGLFHLFELGTGKISLETLEQAIGVVAWFSQEFMRVLAPPPQLPQIPPDQLDAYALEVWFAQHFRHLPVIGPLSRTYVLQYGPPALRRATRLSLALERLVLEGKVEQYVDRKKCFIRLNLAYFTRQQIEFLCNQAMRIV